MGRKVYTHEQKLAKMRERQARRAASRARAEAKLLARAEARLQRLKTRIAQERRSLKDQIKRMAIGPDRVDYDVIDWTMAFPNPEQRAVVRAYRANRGWSLRKMARWCACFPRQIEMLESDRTSVYLLKTTWRRIYTAVQWNGPIDTWDAVPRGTVERSLVDPAPATESEHRKCSHCGAEFDWAPVGPSACSIMCAQGEPPHEPAAEEWTNF